ncbi:MAG: hypothetical protein A2Y10_08335 [Planctomycetes bacterium GWF2_41_51]|nr:MAG: hypothetical protein A2Y10_08335 [Planctomycetes bacterium GWF2_41_51]HBG25842.1 hypothetical protein [Phycisphaerales bacterium]
MTGKIVTDIEADESLISLKTGQVVKDSNFDELCQNYLQQDCNFTKSPAPFLNDGELKLLKAIVVNPMQPSTDYIKFAGISPNSLAKLRVKLVQQGFIKEHRISNDRGRPSLLWEPLDKAIQIVQNGENHAR